jgi:hypothetical protein
MAEELRKPTPLRPTLQKDIGAELNFSHHKKIEIALRGGISFISIIFLFRASQHKHKTFSAQIERNSTVAGGINENFIPQTFLRAFCRLEHSIERNIEP